MSARDFWCCSGKVVFLVFWKKLSFLCCSHIKSGPEYWHFYTGKMGQFWSKSATLNIFKFPYFVFFAISGKFHAIWLKNKEAIAVQNLVCKILGLHLVRNSNRNISATVWRLARKFWYNIVCKKEQHIKTKKRWWSPWSNFVWVLCAFAFNCFHLVNLILGFISSLLSTKLLQRFYIIFF